MNSLINSNLFLDVAKLIKQADALLICAGAGMGVDASPPDFRGNHGSRKAYPALEQKGFQILKKWCSLKSNPSFA